MESPGISNSYKVFKNSDNIGTILVYLSDIGFTNFSSHPADELFDLIISLDDIFEKYKVKEVEEKLAAVSTDKQRIKNVEQFLLSELKDIQIHTKSLFDIFFELKTNSIVQQSLSPYYLKVPQIMGYLCSADKRTFITTVSDSLVTALNNQDTTIDIFGRLVINDLVNPETLVSKQGVTEKIM